MPTISNKGLQMPASPIRKLVPYAEQAKSNGVHVYHLNIGQPDIETPKVALEAVRNNTLSVLAYSHSEGSLQYRKKLTHYYQKHNIEVSPEDIIVTCGGSEALLFTFGSIMDPDDEVIIPEPFYANYSGFSIASSIKVVPVVSELSNDFALPPIEAFEALITPKTKAILICNPGNPTGYLYSKSELIALGDLAKKHDLFLISDEVYREFVYDGEIHHSVMTLKGLENHTIMIDSVSKRYSMCGARVGCVVSRNKEVQNTVLKFAQARLSPPTLAQIASEAALDTPDSYFKKVISEYADRRDTLISGLLSIEGVKVAKPKGAFYCVAELPVEDTEHFAQWILEEFRHHNATVMVAPASGFYSSSGLGKNQVRIAYVLNKEDLIAAVEILNIALKAYNNKR